MTDRYTEDEVLAAVPPLTRARLTAFVETEVVVPLQTDAGPRFRQVDMARMELLCDLCDHFELEAEALEMVMSLIDQLHTARADLLALTEALAEEPPEVQRRIAQVLAHRRGLA